MAGIEATALPKVYLKTHWWGYSTIFLFRPGTMLGCLCVLQMGIKELSQLQSELDTLKEENKQMEDKLLIQHGLSRDKVC